MKDYAHKEFLHEEPKTQQQKLEEAIGYLKARKIWRGQVDCQHTYVKSDVHPNHTTPNA